MAWKASGPNSNQVKTYNIAKQLAAILNILATLVTYKNIKLQWFFWTSLYSNISGGKTSKWMNSIEGILLLSKDWIQWREVGILVVIKWIPTTKTSICAMHEFWTKRNACPYHRTIPTHHNLNVQHEYTFSI